MLKSSSIGRLKGIALNELLVIIVIIAVLLALIFPTINTVSSKGAPQARCLFNLKKVAAAIKIYILDFKSMPDDSRAVVNTAYQSNAADKKDGTGVNEYLDLLFTHGINVRKTFACADPAIGAEESVINTYTYIYRSVDTATAASAVALCPPGNRHGRPMKVTPTAYYGGYAEIRDKDLDQLPMPSSPGWLVR